MLDDPVLSQLFGDLITQWNIAERRIKRAEQVRENEIVSTAIYELRYAGRKVTDAIHIAQTEDWKASPDIYNKIRSYLDDAIEDCVKAKHDAIDSMIDFVTTWLYQQERQLGLAKMQEFYPDYLYIAGKIAGIQDLIAESRGDRTKRRDTLYDEIEASGYHDVIQFYFQVRKSLDRVQNAVNQEAVQTRKNRIRERIVVGVGVIEIVVGLTIILLHSNAFTLIKRLFD